MKPNGCNWSCRLFPLLCAALSIFTLVTLVWALDKHVHAKELSEQLAQQHQAASEQHQQLLGVLEQNQQLRSRLAHYQRQQALALEAQKSGQAQVLQQQDGVAVMQQPNGAVRYTATVE
ncbi:hypothetical protein [Ferrimonas pelagia]|uniref:DUF2570 domain-containing protein n=1 Tax=Ferrimonas pelagia TaxID=1177826 RepID=A0ABP9EC36_9GAMM